MLLRSLPIVLALTLSAGATAVQAQTQTPAAVGAAEIRAIAERETLWCAGWDDADQSCESLALYRPSTERAGEIDESVMLQIAAAPEVRLVVYGASRFEGDRLCTDYAVADVRVVVLIDGTPADEDVAAPVVAVFEEAMAEFEGKRICTRYLRVAEDRLRDEVTVDGARREDLESEYRLFPFDRAPRLRAPGGPDLDTSQA